MHVAGASSGAGTAVIRAATYPDVFATATSVAGGEYGLNQVDPDDPDSTPPDHTARQAWAQMADRARQVPLLVVQGEDDDVVPPLVATRLVEHWTAVSDHIDDGLLNDSLNLIEETTTVPAEQGRHAYTHTTVSHFLVGGLMRQIHLTQRVEAGAVALLAVAAAVVLYPAWWWVLLAAFLVFDLSMLGYVRSPAAGATSYNLVHNYAFPALAGLTALVTQPAFPVASTAAGVLACAWAFHVGVDRALGYGLKMPDAFRHTHLGRIGKDPVHDGHGSSVRWEPRP